MSLVFLCTVKIKEITESFVLWVKPKILIEQVIAYLKSKHSDNLFVCLFLLLNIPSQQLWSLRDGQFT